MGVVRIAGATRDRADTHIAVIDVPAVRAFLVRPAGEVGHAHIKAQARRSGKPSYGGGRTRFRAAAVLRVGPPWISQDAPAAANRRAGSAPAPRDRYGRPAPNTARPCAKGEAAWRNRA